jgi:hypothetical protein
VGRLVGQDELFHRHLASPALNVTGRVGRTRPECRTRASLSVGEVDGLMVAQGADFDRMLLA